MDKKKEILIVGLGLLGGSYAMGLSKRGWRVSAIDRDEFALAYAREKGIIDEGASRDFEPLVERAGRIVFALYPAAFVEWVRTYKHLFRPGLIFTDVSGVK